MTTFQLASKSSKVANRGFCKFGSFQPYLTHTQMDWSTMIESPFIWHPTCLIFAQVVWWSTTRCTTRTTWRRRPGRKLTLGYIESVHIFFKKGEICYDDVGWHESFFNVFNMSDHIRYIIVGCRQHHHGEDNIEEKTREDADIGMYYLGVNLFNKDVICCCDGGWYESVFMYVFNKTDHKYLLVGDHRHRGRGG